MLSLEEAIRHCEEVAEKNEKECKNWTYGASRIDDDESRKKQYLKHAEMWHECAKEHRQFAEWLRELKKYKIKFEYIISQLEERARQLEYILEQNSWCDGDEEYRLDEINAVVEFIKKTYELKSVLDIREVNADDNIQS